MLYFWNEEINVMKYSFALLLIIIIAFWGCEKDDICSEDTETTPRLILRFYDNDNPENIKTVPNILVNGLGSNFIVDDLDGSVSRDSIVLPLKTNALETQFRIYKDFSYDDNGTPDDTTDDIIGGNEDILTVDYNVEFVYVSRACGYKTIFTEVILTIEDDGDNWILNTQPVNDDFQNIENERAAHFQIFH